MENCVSHLCQYCRVSAKEQSPLAGRWEQRDLANSFQKSLHCLCYSLICCYNCVINACRSEVSGCTCFLLSFSNPHLLRLCQRKAIGPLGALACNCNTRWHTQYEYLMGAALTMPRSFCSPLVNTRSSVSPWRRQEEEDIHRARSVIISATRPAALTFIIDTDVSRQVGEGNL